MLSLAAGIVLRARSRSPRRERRTAQRLQAASRCAAGKLFGSGAFARITLLLKHVALHERVRLPSRDSSCTTIWLCIGGRRQVRVENEAGAAYTVVHLEADSRPGLLTALTVTFGELGLEVLSAKVDGNNGRVQDTFRLQTAAGAQVSGADALINIKRSIEVRRPPPASS